MAKVAFSKLGIKKVKDEIKIVQFNGIDIEVKQYLPIQDKLTIIGNAINNAADNNRFENCLKLDAYLSLEIIYAYTNISFTDKQKEDASKLYDMLFSSGLIDIIEAAIPEDEKENLKYDTEALAKAMYRQMNSLYGIMENISADYSNVGEAVEEMEEKVSNPNNLTLLKDVVKRLG